MTRETPTKGKCECGDADITMIGGIGKTCQIGHMGDDGVWKDTGMKEVELVQCESCKRVYLY